MKGLISLSRFCPLESPLLFCFSPPVHFIFLCRSTGVYASLFFFFLARLD